MMLIFQTTLIFAHYKSVFVRLAHTNVGDGFSGAVGFFIVIEKHPEENRDVDHPQSEELVVDGAALQLRDQQHRQRYVELNLQEPKILSFSSVKIVQKVGTVHWAQNSDVDKSRGMRLFWGPYNFTLHVELE